MAHGRTVRGLWGLALVPAVALAGSVFLNGVNIDGVTSQKFERANVRIDERGNIFIDAPGYAVKSVQPGSGGPSGTVPVQPQGPMDPYAFAQLTKRYWLVTEQTVPGMTEYDIDVFVNAKWIRKLRNNEDQVVSEVTRELHPGRNTVLLTAKKSVQGATRKSFSPEHAFSVIIGEGNVGGENVMIDNPLVRFRVTAADTDDQSKEFTFTTR